ncbi:BlaI/MecI/CopY family transcriptional regulator [Paenibacillus doosanensis]|uniref:Penicillinase repressor n=1 Tax=Paenibacillus konkukensis TaxID=2020716 RepID=A0ABY4S2L1_9BACL|nr:MULTISPECIES: BlaI/MecI/CopY family transcriptional regulator [Paenibacillus]MCS7464955.1 BlaI/MecI/CopY family transcriptional regulator [Paenibacillus doosanensis]UQZ87598.1 Penicillinase repressor [Paenibacillus konkukensis]
MSNIPRISESELEIMRILWAKTPCTANDVIEELNKTWKPNTVKTFISRLVKKNVVSFKEDGRSYYYYPLVSEEEYLRTESESFLKRIYGGALKPMLVNFIRDDETLSSEDIAELKRLLDKKE